jgi:hypothetical protein
LLCAGSLAWLGVSLPRLLAGRDAARVSAAEVADAQPAASAGSFGRAKSCIMLFMWGGPAHQDTWDMKPGAPVEVRGEFGPIDTVVPGIQICEHFPRLAKMTDHLAIIRSMTHGDVNHTTATSYLLTGQPPVPSGKIRDMWPNVGGVLAHLGRGSGPIPPFVQMRPKVPGDVPRFVEQSQGQMAGWLGQEYDPLTIDADPNGDDYEVGNFGLPADVPISRLDDRRVLLVELDDSRRRFDTAALDAHDAHVRRAFELLDSSVGAEAFRLDDEPNEVRERYGRNPHGQSVLQARRLVERGVPLVTAFWPNDGIKNVSVYWDTHSRNFIDLKDRLMPPADLAFTALLEDLEQRGMLDETLVIWTGEFGRTPKVGQRNSDAGAGSDGRDHWPNCFTTVLAGGGIRGGIVHGASDRHAAYPAADATRPVDLLATVYHLLGVPPELVLTDRSDRPLVVCAGDVISGLM